MKSIRIVVVLLALLMVAPGSGRAALNTLDFQVVIINDFGQFQLYTGDELFNLMNSATATELVGAYSLIPGEVNPTATYDLIEQALNVGTIEIWFFNSPLGLAALSEDQLSTLLEQVRNGAIVGMIGDAQTLMGRVNLHGSGNYSEITHTTSTAFVTDGTLDTAREDFSLILGPDLTIGEAWWELVTWAGEQLFSDLWTEDTTIRPTAHIPANAGQTVGDELNPWQSTYTKQVTDSGKRGSSATTISVYKLDSNSTEWDWYRVGVIMQGNTKQYIQGIFYWGWWMCYLDTFLYRNSSAIEIIDHMPPTTLSSTSKSFSIGGSLEAELDPGKYPKGKVDVEYSESYDVPDMVMMDTSDIATGVASWSAVPRQPDFTWVPVHWTNPAKAAQSSYQYKPSVIIRVPKGNNLDFYSSSEVKLRFYRYYTLVIKDEESYAKTVARIVVAPE